MTQEPVPPPDGKQTPVVSPPPPKPELTAREVFLWLQKNLNRVAVMGPNNMFEPFRAVYMNDDGGRVIIQCKVTRKK